MPDTATIPQRIISGWLLYRFMVITIVFGFGKHEKIFMRARRSILDAFRHHIRLVPHNVATEKPPIVL